MSETDRFAFGENWRAFLATMDEERIANAMTSLCEMSSRESLAGTTFLDLGSGSGLFSLAANRLGAEVVSIDFDPASVECTESLRQRYGGATASWKVSRGSVLDEALMESLGEFDLVYSWGVLHHTGNLSRAVELTAARVRPGGQLLIAIYNDQGAASRRWLAIKKTYHRMPRRLRPLWVTLVAGGYECKFALSRLLRGKNPLPFADWRAKKLDRGMSAWHDWVDWIGGLPFEVATPEEITAMLESRGFSLQTFKGVGKGWGCNEYVFERRG